MTLSRLRSGNWVAVIRCSLTPEDLGKLVLAAATTSLCFAAEKLVSGTWRRKRFERSRYVMVLASYHGTDWVCVEKVKPEHLRGQLLGPGGKVEAGETVEQAAARELLEETGCIAGDWQRLGVKRSLLGYDIAVLACRTAGRPRTTTDEQVYLVDARSLRMCGYSGYGQEALSHRHGSDIAWRRVWYDLPYWGRLAERALRLGKDLL